MTTLTLQGSAEHRMLQALNDHSELILRGVHSTLGEDVHLEHQNSSSLRTQSL